MAPLDICVVGPTASGKTALGIALAEMTDSEIISADAMQVYRRMDIGTAKASRNEQQRIPHHLIDVVEPSVPFTVVDFQRLAFGVRDTLHAAQRGVVIVGGTGLYVRSYVDELEFPARFSEVAASLETEPDTLKLYEQLERLDNIAAKRIEPNNRRRVIRALEVTIGSGRPFSSFGPGLDSYPDKPDILQVGLELSRELLDQRIEDRFALQLEQGFLAEVAGLARDLVETSAQALGYKELLAHVNGEVSLEEAVAEAISRTRRFARRQQRWFRRDPRIHWIDAEQDLDCQLDRVRQNIADKRSASGREHGNLETMSSERGTDCVS